MSRISFVNLSNCGKDNSSLEAGPLEAVGTVADELVLEMPAEDIKFENSA
jgi:hypothetical protein